MTIGRVSGTKMKRSKKKIHQIILYHDSRLVHFQWITIFAKSISSFTFVNAFSYLNLSQSDLKMNSYEYACKHRVGKESVYYIKIDNDTHDEDDDDDDVSNNVNPERAEKHIALQT